MRTVALTMSAFLLVPVGAGPAHAGTGRGVRVFVTPVAVPLDAGYQVAVLCNAEAASDDPTDVAAATVVTCSLNGVGDSRGLPGSESYVTVSDPVPSSPYTVCISGQVAFVNAVTND